MISRRSSAGPTSSWSAMSVSCMANIQLIPDARADDGMLDVLVASPRTLSDWVRLTTRVLTRRRAARRPAGSADRVAGSPSPWRSVTVQLDGDTVGECNTLTAEVVPGALRLRVPRPVHELATGNGEVSLAATRSGRSCGCPGPGSSAAQLPQPGRGCGVLLVRGAVPDDRLSQVGPRVAAEEDHVAADPMQSHHRLGQPGVVDVTLGVNAEAVVTKALLGRARLDPAQVHAAAGELFEDLKKGTRMVVAHEQDHGGLVGASGRADRSGPRDQHKSRDRVGIVSNAFRKRVPGRAARRRSVHRSQHRTAKVDRPPLPRQPRSSRPR